MKGNREVEDYLRTLFSELYFHLQGAVISIGLHSEFRNQRMKLKDEYQYEIQKLNNIIKAFTELNPTPKLGIDRLLPLRDLIKDKPDKKIILSFYENDFLAQLISLPFFTDQF